MMNISDKHIIKYEKKRNLKNYIEIETNMKTYEKYLENLKRMRKCPEI